MFFKEMYEVCQEMFSCLTLNQAARIITISQYAYMIKMAARRGPRSPLFKYAYLCAK